MTRYAVSTILMLLVVACGGPAVDEDQTPRTADPGTASESPSPSPTAMPTPAPSSAESPPETATPTTTPESDPDLFADTDTCTNDEDGWTVEFPESWWTNTAFTHSSGDEVPACWMFASDEFEAADGQNSNQPGSGSEINLELVRPPGMVGVSGEAVNEEELTVDGFDARRVEWEGTASDTTEMGEGERLLQYVVELPDDLEFMAFAGSERTDDYDVAVEVLDGMMERITFDDY